MVAGFRRSLSLPGPNPSSPGRKGRALPEKAYHVRSTSLPCRSHPAVASLEDEIRALRSWQSRPEPESGSADWICAGLARIELLHASLDDLLQLPQAQDTLRRRSSAPWTDRLLDDFLRFADAYGSFRSVLISLKETQSELQTAIRRRDEARVASSVRYQKRIQKDLAKLAVSIREASRSPTSALAADAAEAEMAGIMREATAATAMASAAVFLAIGAVSSAASAAAASTSRASSWVVGPLRKLSMRRSSPLKKRDWEEWESEALERLEALEECVESLESKTERVFRSLVNTRVSLLNILTPSL
ncbi:uncharacterized protein LOC120104466 [Phoenix dactylifera]|uniref:Uncharacterized protein LOC103723041 n=1 Tax=Phoenix dactylifera TaxID=42345 RepID=A0A8B8ZIM3_PHODC|nr:uncharacterized protein LOC103723041 [Phoenix dactylifera]XP_038971594.1 uncharacterized protein LOC120104466 [Phoenix dactylifera]